MTFEFCLLNSDFCLLYNNLKYYSVVCSVGYPLKLHCDQFFDKTIKKKYVSLERHRAFKACSWPQILLKNKFWNLGEKTIPKNSHISRLLTSFILQVLPWQHAEEP